MMDSARAIENLLYRYAECIDAGDLTGMAQLFEHAVYQAEGGPELRDWHEVEKLNRYLVILYDDGTPKTKHVTTNAQIEVDEDAGTASCRSYFSVFQGVGGPPAVIVQGRYHDRFERAQGAWRFSARRIFMEQRGDLSRHLRLERLRVAQSSS